MRHLPLLIYSLFPLSWAVQAHAYIGPGAGVTVLGSVFALLSAIFLSLFVILMVPVRRYRKKKLMAKNALLEQEKLLQEEGGDEEQGADGSIDGIMQGSSIQTVNTDSNQ